jgi:hypothetical protein
MSQAALTAAAAGYLAALERELADLEPEERAGLLEEVEESLVEAGEDPVGRLGPPSRFAAELRASAGLPLAPLRPPEPRPSAWQRVKDDPIVRAAARAARDLAPLWWAARAGVAAVLVAIALARVADAHFAARRWLVLSAIMVCSLAVSLGMGLAGRRRMLPLRGARIALDLLLLVAGLVLLPWMVHRVNGSPSVVYEQAPIVSGLAVDGTPVTNVYAYDAKGRLLHDVRIYDQNGRPLDVGDGTDPTRRKVLAKGGKAVLNAFPIRYFDPGTAKVAHPNAVPPGLAPKPLSAGR